MRFYEKHAAPNPRRARFFMAEKGVDLDAVEFVELDLAAGDNLTEDFARKNPMLGVPVLEFADGTCISESVAISRYFETLHPEPALMGSDARDQAHVTMWQRRIELGLLLPTVMAFRHTTGQFADREELCPEYGRISFDKAKAMFGFLNEHLADNQYVAGEAFSIADITAVCAVDFAARAVDLSIGDAQPHLDRWYDTVSARPAAKA
ncbi:glutathione S-transferase family protein [Salinisphaera orenii]|uniref:glutathione S-transferase family protein n=1 Tax=Salinisphaera orenii TaxID=856731 RepID=UPI000DBE1D27